MNRHMRCDCNRDEQYEPRVYPRMGCLNIQRTETITYIPPPTTTTLLIQSQQRRTRKVKILLKIITRKTTNHGNRRHQHRRRERETKTITITIPSFRVDKNHRSYHYTVIKRTPYYDIIMIAFRSLFFCRINIYAMRRKGIERVQRINTAQHTRHDDSIERVSSVHFDSMY